MSKRATAPSQARKDDSLSFEALDLTFDYTNAEWCKDNLSYVRLAVGACRMDRATLEQRMREWIAERPESADELLSDLEQVQAHLAALAGLLDMGIARLVIVFEKIADARPRH
jgi:hypothetical protein